MKYMLLNKEFSALRGKQNKHVMPGCILKTTSEPSVKIILSFSNCTVCKHWSDIRTSASLISLNWELVPVSVYFADSQDNTGGD